MRVPPPQSRGAIGVSRRGVRPAGPPPTSPPTVIVAVIGINQRAHLATTTATTEEPTNAGWDECHYYGDDGGTKRRGRVVPSLPQHGGRSGLVEEEWASRRDPPPTSPPTVIVAVIGINQRAHPSHYYGDDGRAPNAGWDEWCLPPAAREAIGHGRRSGLVEEEWASRRDPPPTSPPTVIVAVIGINQRAHLATTTATTEAPNAVVSRGRGVSKNTSLKPRPVKSRSSPALTTARTSRRAQSEQCGNNQQYPSSAPLLEAGNTNNRRKRSPCWPQTRWWGLSRTSQRPPQTQGSPALTTARPRGTHGRGSMDTPTLPTVGDLPRGGDKNKEVHVPTAAADARVSSLKHHLSYGPSRAAAALR
ncbi:hypothetical protein O3P69_012434 [Scylla paramamosain]|uniref:Uncharacterized protein n=1 Tax=Scylla paramamosain TaxID=85552 RepID=A0AAW0SI53_SCYPA